MPKIKNKDWKFAFEILLKEASKGKPLIICDKDLVPIVTVEFTPVVP